MKKYVLLCLFIGLIFGFTTPAIAKKPIVNLQTNMGDIILELDNEKAPITVKNFLDYTRDGFYDGTIFHRVIPNFMIQGGGFKPGLSEKVTKLPIKNEAQNGLANDRGTIAMARTSVINSATSQFFINVVDNDFLNYKSNSHYGYAVFGKVMKGMDIVDQIARTRTHSAKYHKNVPVSDIIIEKAIILREADAK